MAIGVTTATLLVAGRRQQRNDGIINVYNEPKLFFEICLAVVLEVMSNAGGIWLKGCTMPSNRGWINVINEISLFLYFLQFKMSQQIILRHIQ